MSKVHLIMPMGGRGSRFEKFGYDFPKPLLKINDKPFFYWATQSIYKFVDVASITFVVLQEHIDKYSIDKEILSYYPDASIVVLEDVLNGAVLTCMEGVKKLPMDEPIVFNDCDHIFRCEEFENFCNTGCDSSVDGALLTFTSDEDKFSFVHFNEEGFVDHTVEKQVISDQAICGCYYFGSRQLFEEAVAVYLDNCNYQEYFVSGVYNVLADMDKKIVAKTCDFHLPFGVPEEYEAALESDLFGGLQ